MSLIAYHNEVVLCGFYHAEKRGKEISLLPIDHARAFPLSFNTNDRSVLKGKLNFYNKPFYDNYDPERFLDHSDAIVFSHNQNVQNNLVIYNVLDNCFGHSLLKLFLAVSEKSGRSGEDTLLIVPEGLAHYVRDSSFTHIVRINKKFSEFEKCHILNKVVNPLTGQYPKTTIFPVHTYGVFEKETLLKELNLFNGETPVHRNKRIIFHYRKDYFRKWNGNSQHKKVIGLFASLKSNFSDDVVFTVTGDKDPYHFPAWIDDKRTSGFSAENDFHYNRLFNESILVFSLTGSHMLLPSLLANATVHLFQTYKFKNFAEDITHRFQSSLSAFYSHFSYFGNYNCSDLRPSDIGKRTSLLYLARIQKEYKLNNEEMSQEDYLTMRHSYFNYLKVLDQSRESNADEMRKLRRAYYLGKFFQLFKK